MPKILPQSQLCRGERTSLMMYLTQKINFRSHNLTRTVWRMLVQIRQWDTGAQGASPPLRYHRHVSPILIVISSHLSHANRWHTRRC